MSFNNFFNPKGVALIGASEERGKLGNDILLNLIDSKRKIFPVNPKHKVIENMPCYASILDVKEEVNLAIIAIPGRYVPDALRECGKRGVHEIIVISSGFLEIGNKELNDELKKAVEEYKLNLIGPNCLGVISGNNSFNGSFYSNIPSSGGISFISQSGAIGVAVLDKMIEEGIGLSKFISIGNAVNISFSELIEFLDKDKETKVICIYAEDISDARKFFKISEKCSKKIIVLKSGRSASGIKAAMTHTAAMAAPDKIYDGAFKQFNISRVDNIEQLLGAAQLIADDNVPKGRRGIILTNAGGAGVLGADSFEANGIECVKIPDSIIKKLDVKMPFNWSRSNPIDVVGDAKADRYGAVLKEIAQYSFYDFVFAILTPQTMSEPEKVANLLADFKRDRKVATYGCFMGGGLVSKAKEILRANNIANFDEPEKGIEIVSRIILNS